MLPRSVSRRNLLKALLAAGGGVAAASFLPAKWLKPVVNSGVLPVHAQASSITQGIVVWVVDLAGAPLEGSTVGIVIGGTTLKSGFKLAKPRFSHDFVRPVYDYEGTTDASGFVGFSLDPGLYGVCCGEYQHCQNNTVLPGQQTIVNFPMHE